MAEFDCELDKKWFAGTIQELEKTRANVNDLSTKLNSILLFFRITIAPNSYLRTETEPNVKLYPCFR